MLSLRLKSITSKWWFYVILFVIPLFIPPYTSKPMTYGDVGDLIGLVLRESLTPYLWLAPILHLFTIVFIFLLWKFNFRVIKYFYMYLAVNFVFIALVQNITVNGKYGFVIISNNLLQILLVGILWVPAFFSHENEFVFEKREKWRFWAVPLVMLAFWSPMTVLGQPDFNPLLLLTSEYGLAFCFTAPVMIFILTLYYPNIYKPAYRFLCIVGVYFGLLNLSGPLILSGYPFWVAILHIPLFTISIYGLLLEKIKTKAHSINEKVIK
ncbi:MAG TPA: hypothetical protein VMT57_03905 [Candidatus Thermoplasmatota archaeon]|nr:hypothetical protein [Candidatus Thermoplasmatota archaeon]